MAAWLSAAGAAVAGTSSQATANAHCPWVDSSKPAAQRVEALMAQMSLDDKIHMVHGAGGSAYAGHVPAIPRLCIPALNLEDGSAGVGNEMTGVTQLPAPIAAAASWDRSLIERYGHIVGVEERGKGANVTLGPDVNLARVLRNGRTFEGLGEDPYLAAQMGAADVKGIQGAGEIATTKQWVANNQETDRHTVSENVSERVLHEIYMPAFEAAVKQAHTGAMMCANNKVNHMYVCQNSYLLHTVLRGEWAFRGWVMSDWAGTQSTVRAAMAGLDQQMPSGSYFGRALKRAVLSGKVPKSRLDQMVERILDQMFRVGLFQRHASGSPDATVTGPRHAAFARRAAERGTVLLKNADGILPLEAKTLGSIALIGNDAGERAMTAGGGSAHVIAPQIVTPYAGISKRVGNQVKVKYVRGTLPPGLTTIPLKYLSPPAGHGHRGHGLRGAYFANSTLSGKPALTRTDATIDFHWHWSSPAPGVPRDDFSVRWVGLLRPPKTGTYIFALTSDAIGRLDINGKRVISMGGGMTTKRAKVELTAGEPVRVTVEYADTSDIALVKLGWQLPGEDFIGRAARLAASSDVAVVFANDHETEGADRASLSLPGEQDRLIEAVAAANPNTVVVLNTGSAVTMPWINRIKGLIEAWYPGQADGEAIAAVLFGDRNPSGKLPLTFPKRQGDTPIQSKQQYPGVHHNANYSEGLLVGYRWYDAKNIKPLFPFGYGLSYTTFSFANLRAPRQFDRARGHVSVQARVTNTGRRAGSEVVHLYIGDPPGAGEPPKQLKGFRKVYLEPNQTKNVTFTLPLRAFSHWDADKNAWIAPAGAYRIMVGDSSRHLPLAGTIHFTHADRLACKPVSTVPIHRQPQLRE